MEMERGAALAAQSREWIAGGPAWKAGPARAGRRDAGTRVAPLPSLSFSPLSLSFPSPPSLSPPPSLSLPSRRSFPRLRSLPLQRRARAGRRKCGGVGVGEGAGVGEGGDRLRGGKGGASGGRCVRRAAGGVHRRGYLPPAARPGPEGRACTAGWRTPAPGGAGPGGDGHGRPGEADPLLLPWMPPGRRGDLGGGPPAECSQR